MPCPFRHEGEPAQEPNPRKPHDWIRDWYIRDVNISRRVGWSGRAHDAFVAPFAEAYRFADKVWTFEGHPSTSQDVFGEVLRKFSEAMETEYEGFEQGGIYEPGPDRREMFPPVKDVSFVEFERPPHPKRGFGPFAIEEEAIAEVFKPVTPAPPLAVPSQGNDPIRSGIPEVNVSPARGFAGGGYFMNMSDRFNMAKDLITPAFRQADLEL